MNLQFSRSRFPRRALHGVIAILCVASLPWSSFLVQAQEAPQAESQEMTTRRKLPRFRTTNWILWWRRSRFIPTTCWLKRWPLLLTRWKSCS